MEGVELNSENIERAVLPPGRRQYRRRTSGSLAQFKRRYKVKTKNGPPFKMFLFIFREASEKKKFKKMKFSGRC